MTTLATLAQLAPVLPFVMTADEQREATGALADLSDEARYYGKSTWETPAVTPQPVVNLIIKAAKRHMKNPEGYNMSRAGDESVGWAERSSADEAGSATFTTEERDRLREYAGKARGGNQLHSVNMFTASRTGNRTATSGLPASDGGNLALPLQEPW